MAISFEIVQNPAYIFSVFFGCSMLKSRTKKSLVKKSNVKALVKFFLFLILLIVLSLLIYFFIKSKQFQNNKIQISDIEQDWKANNYALVYEKSSFLLNQNQYNTEYNFYKGIASFYLALEQIELFESQKFIDEAIFSFRKAMYTAKKKDLPSLYYLLGKAYFQKNTYSSSYFYADLAVKYLRKAESMGFVSSDIPEYLGLSYALLNETEESIRAFSKALSIRESDVLLLSIAQQYFKIQNFSIAKQYIHLASQKTQNEQIILESKLLLAQILFIEKSYDEAFELYSEIIAIDDDNPEAYFGLGLVYEVQGDLVRARAQWRKVINLQINHSGAIQKLSL